MNKNNILDLNEDNIPDPEDRNNLAQARENNSSL